MCKLGNCELVGRDVKNKEKTWNGRYKGGNCLGIVYGSELKSATGQVRPF